MPYCSNCGTDHDPTDSFCPSCGANLDDTAEDEIETEPEPQVSSTKETGTCEKCDSEISVNAEKCPECGHEPSSSGILGGILSGLSAMASVLLLGLILIIWLVTIGTDFGVTDAITLTAFFLFLLLFPAGVLALKFNQELKTPTGDKKDWREEVFGDD